MATSATWSFGASGKPELTGSKTTLVTTNAGAGSLLIRGTVSNFNSANHAKALWAVYTAATSTSAYSQADGSPLSPNSSTGVVDQSVSLTGEISAAQHLYPCPDAQEYVLVIWPGEQAQGAMGGPPEYSATYATRNFWVTDSQQ